MSNNLKTVCEKDKCCGCMACVDICGINAVKVVDSVSVYNAVINEDKCVNCGACFRVCHNNNTPKLITPISWYEGWAKDEYRRKKGSSGGVAMAVAESFIKNGGVVCSCTYNIKGFVFKIVDNIADLDQFSGSKYVKSNPLGAYKTVKKELQLGKKVLFIGLPCQVAALKNFIGNKLEINLYTIDLICHGTPSPLILEKFLNQYNRSLKNMTSIFFRKKHKFQVFDGENSIDTKGMCDAYMISFLNSLSYTENCYECQYATKERVSDLTLGDSWASDVSDTEKQKGISLLLVQTTKGNTLIEQSNLYLKDVNLEKAILNNHQLSHPSYKPKKWNLFFEELLKDMKFNKIVRQVYPYKSFKQSVKRILLKIKLMKG